MSRVMKLKERRLPKWRTLTAERATRSRRVARPIALVPAVTFTAVCSARATAALTG